MLKISIPKPCNENWNKMLPQQQGRFCNSCAKTVVDFTLMNDEEIKSYFINNTKQKVCGRFINTQLERITINLPENIFILPMPYWKRFLTASLIAFSTTLFSCNTNYDSLLGLEIPMSQSLKDTVPSKNNLPPLLGKIKVADKKPVKQTCTQTMGIIARPATQLMGDVAVVSKKIDTAKVKINASQKKVTKPIADTTAIPDRKLMGEISIIPVIKDPQKIKIDSVKIKLKSNQDSCNSKTFM